VYDGATNALLHTYTPFVGWTGNLRVAVGDVNGDGTADVIAAAGPGGGPRVQVVSGAGGMVLYDYFAYATNFTGGVFVAAGDVNGDGKSDVVTGAGAGGGPHVRVFSGANLGVINEFFAYASTFTGGVTVAAGDVTGDGRADVITGPSSNGGPEVKVFSGATFAAVYDFWAYETSFIGGVNVAAGDVNGDGKADVITAPAASRGPEVKVFSGANLGLLYDYYAYDPSVTGGVRVAARDVDGDGKADVITAPGAGWAPHVKVFRDGDPNAPLLANFFAFDPAYTGGVWVG